MKLSNKGIDLIKKYEGFRNNAYLCPAMIWTIGYGNTYYPNGKKVKAGDIVTLKEGEELLLHTVKRYEDCVNQKVTSNINQNMFDALTSFTYNLGCGAFLKSTLLKKVNLNPNDPDIAYQFTRWNKAGGKVLKGLTRRRNEESFLYFSE
ncbi:lysozyme [Cochleicola gelatinilyticus]|uniref:Lysozyme n=1 Tax=Cochleicola gelatinilyticus TaxID=1763537 RepID=A0A167HMV7_9FLAO|nr:lysozyme [Cochleicola gelatinilyticus]OAB78782.1 muraminidase [Cochleicola gelatinilyticus]